MGLDTGFSQDDLEEKVDTIDHAGLEYDLRKDDLSHIVKKTWFCDYAKELAQKEDVEIGHVLVPIRDIYESAESRRQVYRKNVSKESWVKRFSRKIKFLTQPWRKTEGLFNGGLVQTRSLKKGVQEAILLKRFHTLMLDTAEADIPVTLMQFPRITKDPGYLFKRLKPVLEGIDYDTFEDVFRKTSRRDLVHTY